jgi:hypothetical protein
MWEIIKITVIETALDTVYGATTDPTVYMNYVYISAKTNWNFYSV